MLKLRVSLNQMTGEADPQSRYVGTNLEVELDPELIDQPDRLADHARRLFHLAGDVLRQEVVVSTLVLDLNFHLFRVKR